ncbi:alcohol dehydrogenase-like 7 [Ziziphus jujuba]|uniref:alcohol dehydrogenase n=1 Tax=Ziziphus jujuba TaxID=326968 RepID=A0A6P3ZVV4_ZIZJJ|nr:alcohol dehydrogenase-like 7 [Ziziphus jujuba]
MEEKLSSKAGAKPIRCRAAVSRKPGEPLLIEEIIVAPPMPREARIRIICTSLCYSDITFWRMKEFPGVFPRILGHEAIGVVESVGEDVTELIEGDIVIPTFMPDCRECMDCKSEKSNLCSNFPFKVSPWMPRYESSRFKDLNGETLYHFLSVSSFSEYTVVDVAYLTKIDPGFPPNRACLLSCGVSTGVGAAWKTANVEAGSTVAIFGLGSIGLAVAEGARLCGATRIIGVDVNPDKFEIGKKFGVTDFVSAVNNGGKPVSQVITEMTGGGADYCFECVGQAALVQEAYACCRKGWGKTIVLGVDKPGSQVALPSNAILQSGKILIGSLFGGLKPKSDIPVLLKRYTNKELHLDEFVTHEVGFEDINKAFDLLIEGQCLRCVIWMNKNE